MPSKRNEAHEAADVQNGAPVADNPFRSSVVSPVDQFRRAGIETDPALHSQNRRQNALSIGVPLVGTVAAFLSLQVFPPSIVTLAAFISFFVLTGFGITLGLHRYFTHRSFETRPWFSAIIAVAGSWAFQGPIRRWVADHRRHHRFSDCQFDPHSPYFDDYGAITSRLWGFAHSHFLWMLTGLRSSEPRYAADIANDPAANWCSRHYWLSASSGIFAPAMIGLSVGGPGEAVSCALWAGFARVSLLHQLTWSVNSFGHMFGTKQAGATDEARDNPALALMILGEGLHGFHHRFPNAAIKAPLRYDATGALILILEKIGLVWNVKRAFDPKADDKGESAAPEYPPAPILETGGVKSEITPRPRLQKSLR